MQENICSPPMYSTFGSFLVASPPIPHSKIQCVGIGNHKYFLLFVFYTFLSCMYTLILVVARFSTCGVTFSTSRYQRHHRPGGMSAAAEALQHATVHTEKAGLDRPSQLLTILGLLFEGVLFGMFTSCMMFDQADVVRSKVTHIDKYKSGGAINVSGAGAGVVSGVTEVFGGRWGETGRFRVDWLSPFGRVCFPSPAVQDEIMGFCRPCTATAHGMERVVDAARAAVGSLTHHSTTSMGGRPARPTGTVSMAEIV